jgi:hypothetical protein
MIKDSESNLFDLNSVHESTGGNRDNGSSTKKPLGVITGNPNSFIMESGELDTLNLLQKYKSHGTFARNTSCIIIDSGEVDTLELLKKYGSYGTFGRKPPMGPKFKVNTH